MEDPEFVEEVTSALQNNMLNPIDFYRYFITDEIIDLMMRETSRYARQDSQTHEISRRSYSQVETNTGR